MTKIQATLLAVTAAGALTAQNPGAWHRWAVRTPAAADIERMAGDVITRQRNVGLAIAVVHRGRLIYSAGHGYADLEHAVPVARTTRFQIASVTKAFTGLALLRLWDAGRVDLDAPIQQYVPDFPRHDSGIVTLRLLQAHWGGIRGYRAGERDAAFFDRHFDRANEALSVFSADAYADAPGRRPVYSSYGFNLIAAALEGVTGASFSDILRREVIGPLRLSHTQPGDSRLPIAGRARSYVIRADTVLRGRDFDYSYNPGGGNMLSTAEDVAAMGSALLRPGTLSARARALLLEPLRLNGSAGFMAGFGWFTAQDSSARRVLFTTGQIEAFQAGITVWPEHDLAVAITANTEGAGFQGAELSLQLPRRIGALILGRSAR